MRGPGRQQPRPDARAVRDARDLLGVPADAEASELTRAYWRRARLLHPDLSPDPLATEQFRTLHAAYQLALRALQHHSLSGPGSHGRRDEPRPPAPSTPRTDRAPAPPPGWTAATLTTTSPSSEVWVVAGPVHVRPTRRPDPAQSSDERQA
jgi:DnaJ domain